MRLDSILLCAATAMSLATPLNANDLLISELMASNRLTDLDEDRDSSDWIEIYNAGDEPRSLDGYALSTDPAGAERWRLPAMIVPAGGARRVWMSGKDRRGISPEKLKTSTHLPFDHTFIRRGASWRYLLAPLVTSAPPRGWTTREFDDSSWAVGPSGFGYDDGDDATVVPEGTIAVLARRTFRAEGVSALERLVLEVDYDDGFVAYLNGVRVASANSPQEHPDFRSVATAKHEAGAAERFDLTAYRNRLVPGENVLAIIGLNDSPSSDMSLIPSLGTLLVVHADTRLPREGGSVALYDPSGELVDRIDYPPQVTDQSFGRSASSSDEIGVLLSPTPGRRNGQVSLAEPVTATVEFTPPPGRHKGPVDVGVTLHASTDRIRLRYTTDGAVPDAGSPLIDGPLTIETNTVLRVAAFVGAERATRVSSASYFIGATPRAATISIALDPAAFQTLHLDQNAHGRGAEHPAHMEILDEAGNIGLSTDFGMRLHGGWGRRGGLATKKSYRAYFRKDYGTASLTYPIIPGAGIARFEKIVLRAGFNDRLKRGGGSNSRRATQIRDQIIRDLHEEMGGVVAHGAWYAVYINMHYWGIYNVTERLDDEFLDAHLGDAEWDIIRTGGEVVAGSKESWEELGRFVTENDLSIEANYREVARRVDLADFTTYMILNLWAQNHDWPHNNWYAFRRLDGKWRFLSWDAEWGMGLIPSGYSADTYRHVVQSEKRPGNRVISDLFAALVRNSEYAGYFQREVERHLKGALNPDNVVEKITRHQGAISPLMAQECSLVAPGNSPFGWLRAVQGLVQFARERPRHLRFHTRRFFENGSGRESWSDRLDALRRRLGF